MHAKNGNARLRESHHAPTDSFRPLIISSLSTHTRASPRTYSCCSAAGISGRAAHMSASGFGGRAGSPLPSHGVDPAAERTDRGVVSADRADGAGKRLGADHQSSSFASVGPRVAAPPRPEASRASPRRSWELRGSC
ncbi:hypothetical protein PVAP13_7NG113300 [Panicum virgatum]|uniref:Uncharacterized protein n=1 Tax=Panicum virgatum TaxID=38727 RepID=A0A8T0PSW2_PANVG|nr:hypothetical protein PVAP13_7NG113300 [Panicum virgatum]